MSTILGDITNQLPTKRPFPQTQKQLKRSRIDSLKHKAEDSTESYDVDVSYENESDDHYGDGFLPESQESTVFGVDVCVKDCTCSFCTKAAHMWMELNYQDIKARVSATTRMKKEAILLSERIGKSKANERHDAESSIRVAGLESNLRQHWRSLFQNMAGMWEKEGHQLEASLLPVAELRQKLKTELELIATPFEKN